MITKHKVDFSKKLTDTELEMFEQAKQKQVIFDDDCRELTDDELKKFKRVSNNELRERQNENITLSLPYNSLQKAKVLGESYRVVLSTILENVLNDNELIKRYL